MKVVTIGTTVVEMASFGPYKVWDADTLRCPGCGNEVVSGFAEQPIRQDHWKDDFSEWLEEVEKNASRVEYDYEKPQPRRSNA